MATALNDVLADPAGVAADLQQSGAVFGLEAVAGRRGIRGCAVLDLVLAPLPALARDGYPTEQARVVIHPDHSVHAFPRDSGRRVFKHRNPPPLRDLCLQYEADDPALRWLPEDGLEPLITRIHRHLMAEEAWRRTGSWPFEDAPHGQPPVGVHPVLRQTTEWEALRWSR